MTQVSGFSDLGDDIGAISDSVQREKIIDLRVHIASKSDGRVLELA